MSNQMYLDDLEEYEEDEDPDLRSLLETYIRRSEELEARENKVMRQVELMQSAVSSLQAWNQNRKASAAANETVHVDLKEIEEETKKIQEETKRIEEEIKIKMAENRKLEEEFARKKSKQGGKDEFFDEVVRKLEKEANLRRTERELLENRIAKMSQSSERDDPKFKFFSEKLRNLQEKEKLLKKELKEEWEDSKRKKRDLTQKIEALEWGSRFDKQLIDQIRRKTERK